jgi:hypothetical protein
MHFVVPFVKLVALSTECSNKSKHKGRLISWPADPLMLLKKDSAVWSYMQLLHFPQSGNVLCFTSKAHSKTEILNLNCVLLRWICK